MSRPERHVGLEQSETAVHEGGSARRDARRAALEEALLEAFAAGDAERVSLARAELVGLEAPGGDQ